MTVMDGIRRPRRSPQTRSLSTTHNGPLSHRGRTLLLATPIALAAACATIGILVYGAPAFMPNLLAELAGMPLDFMIAILVVERVLNRRQRHEWDFALRELARRSSEAFVDVMRLVFVGSSPEALQANIDRYKTFTTIAARHIDDLRSHLESSAAVLGPHTYEAARRIERRLAWALDQLTGIPSEAGLRTDIVKMMKPTSSYVFDLLRNGDWYTAEIASARRAVSATGHAHPDPRLAGRMQAQVHLLHDLRKTDPAGPIFGIGGDVDGILSVPYFVIDYLLLESGEDSEHQSNEGVG